MRQWLTILTLLTCQLALIHLVFPAAPLKRYEYSRLEMGTLFRVIVYAETKRLAESASYAALDRIQELNGILSDYQTDSELNRVCRTAYESPQVVSPELFFVLQKSIETSRQSEGAFDITIRPLVRLWREAGETGQLPESRRIEEALARIGYQKLLLNPITRSVRLREPQMELDLGGIAKGYALDEAMRILKEEGVSVGMIDGGGDLRIGQPPPGRTGWKVELSAPAAGKTQTLYLSNVAVATSGDLYRYVEIDGDRYSHIVDPLTGYGLNRSPEVTVMAPQGIDADALATALSVMKPEAGINLVERLPSTEARLLFKDDDRIVICSSSGFPP